jgi:UDP-N-acetyl-D-glucosamine dehydrogenase
MKNVAIVGQGYVGLPLALAAVNVGHNVVGVDIDVNKTELISSGKSPIEDISNKEISDALATKRYRLNSAINFDSSTEVICVCVPTPLNKEHKPDLTILEAAVSAVSQSLKAGMLVIIESTIQPGTTREILLPLLEKGSGLTRDQFFLAYSPERIDPLNKEWNVKNTPKLVSGLTQESADKAQDFYKTFIEHTVICPSLEIAETAKLLENAFRFINISFINEIAMFCNKLGIDIKEVIAAASTKPYGFMPFYPSIGVGGHCIPVDPIYLSSKATEIDSPTSFIDLADKINKNVPQYLVARAERITNGLKGKKIIVIGVSYKPNVADTRETPVESLISRLQENEAQVFWHDDLVKQWKGESSTELSDNFDLAVIATPHDYLDLSVLGNVPILDTRGSI